jgi:hypothetical protein
VAKLEYGAKEFDRTAWSAIDRGEIIQLLVRGEKRSAVKRALEFYQEYAYARRLGQKKPWSWWKFGWHGIRAPAFWALYNHAQLAGMRVATEDRVDCLVVTFAPANVATNLAPGSSSTH